jgi:cob(I)alamin adenosyltransferase
VTDGSDSPAASHVPERPIASPGFDSAVATGKGDSGTTGLLFGGDRIRKDDLRTEAYGTIDEAVAALGIARAACGRVDSDGALAPIGETILAIQRELFVAAAELATNPDAWERQVEDRTRVSAAMVAAADGRLRDLESAIVMPREFVVPGETEVSAALEVARTVLRRAERRAVTLDAAGLVPGPHLLPYLNRTADLLWVLARAAEQAEAKGSTPARVRAAPGGSIDRESSKP